MKLLSIDQMDGPVCGVDEQWCYDTADTRYVLTGVFSLMSCIPVVGVIISAPSAIALYAIDGVCLFKYR